MFGRHFLEAVTGGGGEPGTGSGGCGALLTVPSPW